MVTLRVVLLRPSSSALLQNKLWVVRLVLPLSKSVGGTWTGDLLCLQVPGLGEGGEMNVTSNRYQTLLLQHGVVCQIIQLPKRTGCKGMVVRKERFGLIGRKRNLLERLRLWVMLRQGCRMVWGNVTVHRLFRTNTEAPVLSQGEAVPQLRLPQQNTTDWEA